MGASLAVLGKAFLLEGEPGRMPYPRFYWPSTLKKSLGKSTYQAAHNLHHLDQFSDEKLAELLDRYPREKLGIYRFPDHSNSAQKAEHGHVPTLSGADILDAVRDGQIWLNLRAVNKELPEYEALAETIFDQLKQASGTATYKEDVGVLISSPNIHVHYHLDIPLVCLVQIRGDKKISIYPKRAPFVEPDQISAFALRRQDEQMTYQDRFEDAADVISLEPGLAVTWPQTAPHRVQNGNSLNVSLSCEFMTAEGLLKANALHTNASLRKDSSSHAPFPDKVNLSTVTKAGAARVLKKISPLPEKAPTALSFELLKGGEIKRLEPENKAPLKSSFSCRVIKPEDLTEQERWEWKELKLSSFQYDTPLLSPEFMDLVAKSRQDVRCLLVRENETLVAILPVFERSFGLIRPVGAPFSDYAAPIVSKYTDMTLERIIELSGYAAYRSNSVLLTPSELDEAEKEAATRSFIIHLNGQTAEKNLESHRSQHAKRYKNFRRLMNKLERECGKIDFVFGAAKTLPVETLLTWKSRQFSREGLLDITASQNSASILDRVAQLESSEDSNLSGFMTCLKVDGEMIVGHFGIRDETSFHPWISAYNPDFENYSPGILLLYKVIEEMGRMGLESYDLSTGHESYKKYFCNSARYTKDVNITAPSFAGRLQKLGYESWNYIGGENPNSPAARMRRRFDHIFVCEPKVIGRIKEILFAFLKRSGV
ncbi:GNAT family N-acetyltransferase [Litorimonas sp.]|uniref:GNAT family N-acetyltransferase n=1 Tax=Litorimonas sp. TaxID=1892381 RepID=UPI003A84F585